MKKILLFFSILCASFCTLNAQAPDATISANDIQYWVGSGSNQAIFIVSWCSPEVALAWGVRFNGTLYVEDIMDSIAAADSRFSYDGGSGLVNDIQYVDDQYTLGISPDYPMYNMNGSMAQLGFSSQEVVDGDVIKWGGYSCADMSDDWSSMSWSTTVVPVSNPNPQPQNVDATINMNEIVYWVGTGNNQAIFIGNWCNEPNAFAWGYRFDADSVTVETMLNAICAADLRLSYSAAGGFISDLVFLNGQDSLVIAPDYIVYNHNGSYADIVSNEYIHAGDYIKMGGYSCADMDENWVSTWTTPIIPVADPTGINSYDQSRLAVYPNPCVNNVTVKTQAGESLTLINAQGSVIYSTIATDELTNLNMQSLSAGIYFIRHDGKMTKVIKK